MARGVSSSCDDGGPGGADIDGGGGGGGGCRKREVRQDFHYGPLLQYSSSDDDDDDDRGDMFFGTDDIGEFRDFIYKEDVIEAYRRDCAMKSFRRKQKGWLSVFRCFEFLKALCCIPRRDG
ncbi:hypothetical protein ACOSQ4_027462 [Xanthoceras sorbifolium]